MFVRAGIIWSGETRPGRWGC